MKKTTLKIFLICQEKKLSSSGLKNLVIFQEGTGKSNKKIKQEAVRTTNVSFYPLLLSFRFSAIGGS